MNSRTHNRLQENPTFRRLLDARVPLALLSGLVSSASLAQISRVTPTASPAGSLVTSGGAWQATDRCEIDVEG